MSWKEMHPWRGRGFSAWARSAIKTQTWRRLLSSVPRTNGWTYVYASRRLWAGRHFRAHRHDEAVLPVICAGLKSEPGIPAVAIDDALGP